uniref:hypothetical protein n=1 Tax=uncultured Dysgonomonas sp. TaxID=206096 RepID=UPI00260C8FAD|nr:hypothetical protein [uncultured Dysgonomonas sp.]
MKKLFVLFTLVISFSFLCNDLNAQCSNIKDVNIGDIKIGGIFQLSINQGESNIWVSPTLEFVRQTNSYIEYRFVEDQTFGGSGTTIIGEITLSSPSGYKCHRIYGRIIK